jgi:hypothetical protein
MVYWEACDGILKHGWWWNFVTPIPPWLQLFYECLFDANRDAMHVTISYDISF